MVDERRGGKGGKVRQRERREKFPFSDTDLVAPNTE